MNVPDKLKAEDLGMTAEDGITSLYWKINEIIDYLKAEEERRKKLAADMDKELDKFVDKLNGGR